MGCPHSQYDRDDPDRKTPHGYRDWADVSIVLNEMSDTWSGFVAYAYDGPSDFDMTSGGPWNGVDVLTPTADMYNFKMRLGGSEGRGSATTTTSRGGGPTTTTTTTTNDAGRRIVATPPPSAGATRWRPSYCRAATSDCSTMTICRPIGTRVADPVPRGGARLRPRRHSPCFGSSGEVRGVVPTGANVAHTTRMAATTPGRSTVPSHCPIKNKRNGGRNTPRFSGVYYARTTQTTNGSLAGVTNFGLEPGGRWPVCRVIPQSRQ